MIAHDPHHPLAELLFAVRHLYQEDQLDTPANRELLSGVRLSVQYAKRLINNYLSLKEIDAGQVAMNIQVHDLAEIVREVHAVY
jgi:K+-sensing histidine kinase KdpD